MAFLFQSKFPVFERAENKQIDEVIEEMKIRKREKKKGDSPRLTQMKEFVAEGYSLKKAMELAGYSKTTIEKKASEYLRKLDLNVLRRFLKPMSAVANMKALKVLQEEMDGKDSKNRIKAAEVAVKNAKLHLVDDKTAPEKFVFQIQTIQGHEIIINPPNKTDEIIDISSEGGNADNVNH